MLKDVKPKYLNENYISVSKCLDQNLKPLSDKQKEQLHLISQNGRLVSVDSVCLSITNVDFDIIDKVYANGEIFFLLIKFKYL